MPVQLHASSGWISVLSTFETEIAPNGALGVDVAVGGFGVLVGGTSEKGVFVGIDVHVGGGVLLGVSSSVGLAVQVGCNWMGPEVRVGEASIRPPGGKILRFELGKIKTIAKYTPMHAVMTSTRIESISQTPMLEPPDDCLDGFPSKLNSSLIDIAPL